MFDDADPEFIRATCKAIFRWERPRSLGHRANLDSRRLGQGNLSTKRLPTTGHRRPRHLDDSCPRLRGVPKKTNSPRLHLELAMDRGRLSSGGDRTTLAEVSGPISLTVNARGPREESATENDPARCAIFGSSFGSRRHRRPTAHLVQHLGKLRKTCDSNGTDLCQHGLIPCRSPSTH